MNVPQRFWKWADAYYGDAADTIDIEMLYDSAITLEENITLFKAQFPQQAIKLKWKPAEGSESAPQAGNHTGEVLLNLLAKPTIIGIAADVNQGKSMLLYHIIETCSKQHTFKLYYYGLRENIEGGRRVHSVGEIEQIQNSIIVIDELSSLFELDDRKVKRSVEQSLRLINHNNNVVILCGTPENFKKFIAAKLNAIIYKRATIADFINGSRVKDKLQSYRGSEKGSEVLNLPINEALLYDGQHFTKLYIPYYLQYDTKKENESVLKPVRKNVPQVKL